MFWVQEEGVCSGFRCTLVKPKRSSPDPSEVDMVRTRCIVETEVPTGRICRQRSCHDLERCFLDVDV